MFLAVFGTPSALTQWVVNLATVVARTLCGDFTFLPAVTMEALREAWGSRSAPAVVFHSDTPQRALVDFFTKFTFPMVVVMEHPVMVAEYSAVARNLDVQTSLRFTTQSFCTLAELSIRPATLLVTERVLHLGVGDFIDDYLAFNSITAGDEVRAAIRAMVLVGMPETTTVGQSVAAQFPHLVAVEVGRRGEAEYRRAFIDAVATQYDVLRRGEAGEVFAWPPQVFVRLSATNDYLDGAIDLTGPARVLISGHSLSVPRGHWRARATIEVRGNVSGNAIHADVFAEDRPVGGITARLPEAGLFQFDVDFDCEDPFYPIIFRVASLEGAIEGEITLRGLTLTRI